MTSHTPLSQRSNLVGAVNHALPALYKARLLARPELDADALVADVERETGLRDFGGDWFRRPLHVLLAALREEASLNGLGRFAAVGQFRKVLKDRLFAQQLFKANPEIERRSLQRPLIVVGPMRSGTTRLHRLLSADARFAHLRSFETVNPVPPPNFLPGDKDRRWIPARLALGAVHKFNPTTAVIHPTGPFEPEEELGLLVRSMWGMKHEAQWHVPGYGRWSDGQDATPAYRYMARLLRLIGWARGEDDARPWVLKTPQHMLDLPALMKVFPDARIIFTHRTPESVVGSSCSLVWNQMIIHSDQVDAAKIGREWLRKTDLQIERMRAARIAIPESQRIDVCYADVEADWSAVMARIYRFLDMDIGPALPAMTRYITNAGRALHRHPHRYSLSAFGLDAGAVEEQFRSYVDAFGLASSPAETRGANRTVAFPDPASRHQTGAAARWQAAKPARAASGGRG